MAKERVETDSMLSVTTPATFLALAYVRERLSACVFSITSISAGSVTYCTGVRACKGIAVVAPVITIVRAFVCCYAWPQVPSLRIPSHTHNGAHQHHAPGEFREHIEALHRRKSVVLTFEGEVAMEMERIADELHEAGEKMRQGESKVNHAKPHA